MNCFYHQTVPAVGLCKACGKGLCPICAVDFGSGLACKGRCEEEAKAVGDLIRRNISRAPINEKIVAMAWRNRFLGSTFYLAFGLLFLGFAIYRFAIDGLEERVFFFALMGSGFFAFGSILLWRLLNTPRHSG
jgi:hypothetical protein